MIAFGLYNWDARNHNATIDCALQQTDRWRTVTFQCWAYHLATNRMKYAWHSEITSIHRWANMNNHKCSVIWNEWINQNEEITPIELNTSFLAIFIRKLLTKSERNDIIKCCRQFHWPAVRYCLSRDRTVVFASWYPFWLEFVSRQVVC